MIITIPKNYVSHGTLPDGALLYSNKDYSVTITLNEREQFISVARRGIRPIKEVEAMGVIAKFGIDYFERFKPSHPHNAIYFSILNCQPRGEPRRHNE